MSCICLRNDSTERNSEGRARATITPDCALTITLRPSAEPTIAVSDLVMSSQKLLLEVVVTCVLSAVRDTAPPLLEVPPGSGGAPGTDAAPETGVSVIDPDVTR